MVRDLLRGRRLTPEPKVPRDGAEGAAHYVVPPVPLPPTIQATQLSKSFGKLAAVQDLTLQVGAGEVFGFLGPNGAGKTTTIRMFTGLVRPSSGSAVVAGFDVARDPLEVKRRVGCMAETPYLYPKLT